MRVWLPVCLVCLLIGLLPWPAPAQAPPPPAGSTLDPNFWTTGANTDGSFAGGDHRTMGETREATSNPWTLDILIGFPTGVRLQHTFGPSPDGPFILEVIAGLLVIEPIGGVGARVQFTPFSGTHNALVVSPGIDAYVVDNFLAGLIGGKSTLYWFSGNIDIAWRHTYSSGADGRFGIELGVFDSSGWRAVLPEASFFVGWQF